MKNFCSRTGIFLLTFAFGLACVPFFNGICNKQTTVSLDAPQDFLESPIIVYPKYKSEMGALPYFPENKARAIDCPFGSGGEADDKGLKKKVKKDLER